MEFETLTNRGAGSDVAYVTLNRPDRFNALNLQLIVDSCAPPPRAIESDAGIRAVVLTAAGRAFCSGRRSHGR